MSLQTLTIKSKAREVSYKVLFELSNDQTSSHTEMYLVKFIPL